MADIEVVDIFSGPGGLEKGFSECKSATVEAEGRGNPCSIGKNYIQRSNPKQLTKCGIANWGKKTRGLDSRQGSKESENSMGGAQSY